MQDNGINIIWFKRDLRLSDHHLLQICEQSGHKTLLLYVFEPSLIRDPHYSDRHWRFVWQSLEEMQAKLNRFGHTLHIVTDEMIEVLTEIKQRVPVNRLLSYEETGLIITYERDLRVKRWCAEQRIPWHEAPTAGVIRAARDRDQWSANWDRQIKRAPIQNNLARLDTLTLPLPETQPKSDWLTTDSAFQHGGENAAHHTLTSFLERRAEHYSRGISSPALSRKSCSRLSPYLAWGNLSLTQVYQATKQCANRHPWERPLRAFRSRLHWHCHFIQKFESETRMQIEHQNLGYQTFPWRSDDQVATDLARWQQGQTGIPLVDACMRALIATGYINFRMRAMLVSFLCHHLRIDWRLGADHLARQFLDFEPGIHYPQLQMQAGMTGINTLRIYNPTRQAQELDPNGAFIAKWVPELSDYPGPLRITPWKIPPLERQMLNLSDHYPEPIVDLQASGRSARELFWSWRERDAVKRDAQRILATHVLR